MANLPEVDRIAQLRNEDAVISARIQRSKTATQEDHQRLAASRAECVTVLLELEQRFGDGHYAERTYCLDELLSDYERKGVDLGAILDILRQKADCERLTELAPGLDADQSRALVAHAKLIQIVRNGLLKLRESYRTLSESRRAFRILEEIGRASCR